MRRFADRNMSRTAAAQMMFCASSCAACAAMMMNIALNLDASLLASILFVLFILSILVLLAILSLLVRILLGQNQTGSVSTAETKRLAH